MTKVKMSDKNKAEIDVFALDRKQGTFFRGKNIRFILQDFNPIPVYGDIKHHTLLWTTGASEQKHTILKK